MNELVVRKFDWNEPKLEMQLMALNLPEGEIAYAMARKGQAFSIYVRCREPSDLYPNGTPPERWDFT